MAPSLSNVKSGMKMGSQELRDKVGEGFTPTRNDADDGDHHHLLTRSSRLTSSNILANIHHGFQGPRCYAQSF